MDITGARSGSARAEPMLELRSLKISNGLSAYLAFPSNASNVARPSQDLCRIAL
jgi:hypothetical protein